MENEVNEIIEEHSSSDSVTIEPSDNHSVDSETEQAEEILDVVSSPGSDRTDERSDVGEDQNQAEDTEEDTPSSTVIQVIETETGDLDITELDVNSLNIMSESYVEQMLAVTPTSNDYFDFIPDNILEYFSGVMAQYPLNNYRAYHLRHWLQNSQYYSYYDDYYYLFYDFGGDSAEECLEIYKANGSSSYQFNWGTAEVLNASIMYGSDSQMSDFRKGVSYVQEMAFLSVLAGFLVLYIVNAIFKHLRS